MIIHKEEQKTEFEEKISTQNIQQKFPLERQEIIDNEVSFAAEKIGETCNETDKKLIDENKKEDTDITSNDKSVNQSLIITSKFEEEKSNHADNRGEEKRNQLIHPIELKLEQNNEQDILF